MKVLFQSPEFARRSAQLFDDAGIDWPLNKRLLALALMLGYESWESHVATCSPSNPKVIFDQDLDEDAFAKRIADMAHGLSKGMGMIYQEAYDIVAWIRPLDDRARSAARLYVHDEHRDRYQAEETDTWWVSMQETSHPLTIPGFEMCGSVNLAALARARLKGGSLPVFYGSHDEYARDRRAVLVPHGFKKRWTRHVYFRTGELMAFEEQPSEWMLRAPSSHPREVSEWFQSRFPGTTKDEAKAILRSRAADLGRLREMAGISKRPRTATIATVAAREAGGVKWYWPLVPLDQPVTAIAQAEVIARDTQRRYDREAGAVVFSLYT